MSFIFIKEKKNKVKLIKLIVPAGLAAINSPIGPMLGQVGLNAIDFCNLFNERS
jgi:large subunit ribosomal protein L11